MKTTFDTHTLPESTLQSATRPSKSNLRATLQAFADEPTPPHPNPPQLHAYYGPPARILATLLDNHIIHDSDGETARVREAAEGLGLEYL